MLKCRNQRLRDEAPLYYNDRHDFYAVSRYDDVERGLADRETFISGRSFSGRTGGRRAGPARRTITGHMPHR
jgi:hypothetical protein